MGDATGTISRSSADVTVSGDGDEWGGGLVGSLESGGTVSLSHATGSTTAESQVGGLVGLEYGTAVVEESYATGAASLRYKNISFDVGGLVGEMAEGATIHDSYATGQTSGKAGNSVGGLVGIAASINTGTSIATSYSTGVASGRRRSHVGGFLGLNDKPNGAKMTYAYWDTTTSGTAIGVGKGNDAGLKGLTTEQLQSGLPRGFEKKIWAENPNINNGLPYLIHNPPPK